MANKINNFTIFEDLNYGFRISATSYLMCKTCKNLKKMLKEECDCDIIRISSFQETYNLGITMVAICKNKYDQIEHKETRKFSYTRWMNCEGRLDKFIESIIEDNTKDE